MTVGEHVVRNYSAMKPENIERFKDLTFEDFRRLAKDDTLSSFEKIGFPNAYREGKETTIFADIVRKLPALLQPVGNDDRQSLPRSRAQADCGGLARNAAASAM